METKIDCEYRDSDNMCSLEFDDCPYYNRNDVAISDCYMYKEKEGDNG